jgi:hypothetical protein
VTDFGKIALQYRSDQHCGPPMRVTTSHGHPPFLCFGQGIDLQISTAEIPDWLSEPRCGRRYVTDLEARIRRGGRKYRSQGFPRRRARRKAVGRAFAPVENAERQKVEGRTGGKGGGKLPQASKGKTRDKVAKVTGHKARAIEKASAVVSARERNLRNSASLLKIWTEPAALTGLSSGSK